MQRYRAWSSLHQLQTGRGRVRRFGESKKEVSFLFAIIAGSDYVIRTRNVLRFSRHLKNN